MSDAENAPAAEAAPAENAEEQPLVENKSNPPKSEKAKSEAAAADEEDPLNETQASGENLVRIVKDGELCCCCICNCSVEATKNLSCFGCFPIKCGIVCIGILTLFLILFSFIDVFYMLLNEYIHWWYVLVSLLLLVPTIIAASILTAFFNQDNHERRSKLRCACILVIVSFTLLAIWNCFYFQFFYKHSDVMIGQHEIGYIKQTKKQYVFWSVFCSLTIDGFYAYFICVVSSYKNALTPKEDEKDAETSKSK